jgi:hypothetical protein
MLASSGMRIDSSNMTGSDSLPSAAWSPISRWKVCRKDVKIVDRTGVLQSEKFCKKFLLPEIGILTGATANMRDDLVPYDVKRNSPLDEPRHRGDHGVKLCENSHTGTIGHVFMNCMMSPL